jgi:hypothetical protein
MSFCRRKGLCSRLCCLIFTIGVVVQILFTFGEEAPQIQVSSHSPLLSQIQFSSRSSLLSQIQSQIQFSSRSSLRLSSSLLSSSSRHSLSAQDVFKFSSFQIARVTAAATAAATAVPHLDYWDRPKKKSLIIGMDGAAGKVVQEIIDDKCRYPHSGFRDLVHKGTRWDTGGSKVV